MLILASDGLTGESTKAALRPLTANMHRAALVVTADNVYKADNYHVPRCIAELQNLGMTVDIFDIDDRAAEQLCDFDAVEFIGGNPYYLLDSIRRNNAANVLNKIAAEKLLIGWSAAAFVFGPTLALVDRCTPEMNTFGITDLNALHLTETEVLPHYSKFIKRINTLEQICRSYEAERNTKIIRLNDGESLFINGSNQTLCR